MWSWGQAGYLGVTGVAALAVMVPAPPQSPPLAALASTASPAGSTASRVRGAQQARAATITGPANIRITAGGLHSCALDTARKAWCWGQDDAGQVGDGPADQSAKYAPVAVANQLTFNAIAAGTNHTCALDTAGKAWCWGQDDAGQVGDGPADQSAKYAPVAVANQLTFNAITAGGLHTCALDTAGKAWCWGQDDAGQVGDGPTDQSAKYAPVAVANQLTFNAITAGGLHTCALDTAGKAWCWGQDDAGQVGDGPTDQSAKYAPVAVANQLTFNAITAGGLHSCALDTAGKAWCWGYDANIQIGPNGPRQRYIPVQVAGEGTYVAITAGWNHTCLLDQAARAWCWGWDSSGQVGDGPADQVDKVTPVRVVGRSTFSAISAGFHHTCALDLNGTAWCWGLDRSGEVGDGPRSQREKCSPVAVSPSVGVKPVGRQGKLYVDVNPNMGKRYWTFAVQRLQSDGAWVTRAKTYRTSGTKETRTLNLPKGTYRVVVKPEHGYRGCTSAPVRLRR